jgi:flagellar biosynthesis/type III secretory pathway protein FliH
MQTVNLMQPIARAYVVPEAQRGASGLEKAGDRNLPSEIRTPPSEDRSNRLQQEKNELDQLLRTVHDIAGRLQRLHEETLAHHHAEIARLAVAIARKILMYKVNQGDYAIQAIVEEALKRAPARQNLVVRLNPEDLPRCQQLQGQDPQSPFAALELAPDWSIGRGECLVETPKGIVKSFIEEHLEHLGEALQKAQ